MGAFANDPVAFFCGKSLFVHHLPLEQQEALQLEALQQRFAAMRDALPPLRALADAARIRDIRRIEDVGPLLFPHSLFKSYPDYLLDELAFPALTEWLSRLTLLDLSAVKGRSFDAIDHWMDALDADTELSILTSSGTTEALSLLPRGKMESELLAARSLIEWQGPAAASPVRAINHDLSMIWLSYEGGRGGMLRSAEFLRRNYTTSTTRFIPLITARASTDWQYYIARLVSAQKRGRPLPNPTAYVQQKEEEARHIHETHDERVRSLLEILRDQIDGPVHMAGGLHLIFRIADQGLRMGMEPGLVRGSRVSTGGGMKGIAPPPDMEKTILRFSGVDKLYEAYGMTEIGDAFGSCEHGRFHIWPWIVPFIFDEKTGALRPRRGKQRGRAAYFDLSAQTYWGGFVTADAVSISWEPCPCGRTTPQAIPPIIRLPVPEDEHVLAGPTPSAMHMAIHALNDELT